MATTKNTAKSAKLVKVSNKKIRHYGEIITADGKKVKVSCSAAEPCFGNADYAREECKNCVLDNGRKRPTNIALVCFLQAGYGKINKNAKIGKAAKRKTATRKGGVPWGVLMNEYAKNGKAAALALALEMGLTENSAKDTVNHVRIVNDAWNGKGSKNGKYYLYCQWVKKGKKGEQPDISNTAKSYCNKLIKFC